ncbi:MAG: septation protein IspZ [Gammaproteobacteria bacterium]|nr:septation protein IspZ [Gammaproteobacteria bacterium]
MKTLLDLAPALLFFGAYLARDIYVATAVLIAALFGVVAAYWLWKRELHKGHLVAAVLAAVLGGVTLYVHDPVFIKLKPTAVYAVFALALIASHFVGGRVLMQRLGEKALPLPEPLWRRLNLAWAAFFVGCAALNLYVAEAYDEATWVKFKTFGFSALMLLFMLAHAPFVSRYLPQQN